MKPGGPSNDHAWVEPRGEPDRLREAILFGPNVEFPNLPSGPRLTGPDVLLAIAHYMDRKDDEAETEAGGSGWRANRDVQAHLRAWSAKMRAALDHSKDEEKRPDPLRAKSLTMAEYSDTRDDCPKCGEWRDSPTADCAGCGYAGGPSNDE